MAFLTKRAIAVDGLQETIRGLKKINPELARIATRVNRKLTNEIIKPAAEDEWKSQRIKPSAASRVIATAAGQTWAGIRVRYKDESYPWAAGVVFGSWKYKQFRGWVGNQWTGTDGDYIVAPAVKKKGDEFADKWMDAMSEAFRKRV